MSLSDSRSARRAVELRSGFILRVLGLASITCALLFSGLVVLENEEIRKVVPATSTRNLALLFGYLVALIGFNYAMALRGHNLMGWKVESALVGCFALPFVGVFLSFAFPLPMNETPDPVYASVFGSVTELFSGDTSQQRRPNWNFAWMSAAALPLALYVVARLRSLPLWRNDSA